MKKDIVERLKQTVLQIVSSEGSKEEKLRRVTFAFDRSTDIAELGGVEELTAELQPIGTPGSRVEWDSVFACPPEDSGMYSVELVNFGKQTGTIAGYARSPVLGKWIALIRCDSEEVGFLEKPVEDLTFL